MKNLFLVASFTLLSIFQVLASEEPKTSTITVIENEKSIVLNISNKINEIETFKITDDKGEVVYYQTMQKDLNNIKYSLKELPRGKYSIEVGTKNFVEIHETLISSEHVNVVNSQVFSRPTLSQINDKVWIYAPLTQEDIRVFIYDTKDKLVYTYNDEKTENFQKTFDLKNLNHGDYNVVVMTDYFIESINVSL